MTNNSLNASSERMVEIVRENIGKMSYDDMSNIHQACWKNDLSIIFDEASKTDLMNNLESTNEDGMTPLHIACLRGNFGLAKFLISNGANINAKDKKNHTPLFFVGMISQNLPMVKLLIDKGGRLGKSTDNSEESAVRFMREMLELDPETNTEIFKLLKSVPMLEINESRIDMGLETVNSRH